jgi:hypothetical protein
MVDHETYSLLEVNTVIGANSPYEITGIARTKILPGFNSGRPACWAITTPTGKLSVLVESSSTPVVEVTIVFTLVFSGRHGIIMDM